MTRKKETDKNIKNSFGNGNDYKKKENNIEE